MRTRRKPVAAGSYPTILCADDEEANRILLREILVNSGYGVVEARNGREALEKARGGGIELALLDVMMPEINGFDVCRELKSWGPQRSLPVILLTVLRSPSDRISGIEAGADDFISKPFNAAEVVARIKMLLKVRDLNGRLARAYSMITSLISFGEKTLAGFDPQRFDFTSMMGDIAREMICDKDGATEKPKALVVCMADGNRSWRCHRYEYVDGVLSGRSVGPEICRVLPRTAGSSPGTGFINAASSGAVAKIPISSCEDDAPNRIRNYAYYLSDDLRVITLNYGRRISDYDTSVLKSFVTQALFFKSLAAETLEVENAFKYTMEALARASEANDEDTGNHIQRVSEFCAIIGESLGMSGDFIRDLRLHSQMHDVGKIHVPFEILNKPGKLTSREWEIMKRHTIFGAQILGEHARLSMARNIARTHHERMDGGGYPSGLRGEEIPIEGRILHLADQYDALRSTRPYKPAYPHDRAVAVISEGDGYTEPAHFDPDVLNVFRKNHARFEETYNSLLESAGMSAGSWVSRPPGA